MRNPGLMPRLPMGDPGPSGLPTMLLRPPWTRGTKAIDFEVVSRHCFTHSGASVVVHGAERSGVSRPTETDQCLGGDRGVISHGCFELLPVKSLSRLAEVLLPVVSGIHKSLNNAELDDVLEARPVPGSSDG